jgi:RNA polymerase sigma-70 factor (ECF subfamily)
MMNVETVRQMYLDGSRRWPSLAVDFTTFAEYCSALPPTEEMPIEGADLLLCCACSLADPEALKLFERETQLVARNAIASLRRDREFVDETMQEVWDKLFCGANAKIKKYTGRGPLQAWVRVIATRAALDRCRALGLSTAREAELTDRLAAPRPGMELLVSRARYSAAFQTALRDVVARLPARERNVLRMHVCGRCSIDEIGRAYGVHRATAARWLERARLAIREGVRGGLLRGGIKFTDSEYSSLARGMASELELGLSGSFVQPTEPSPTPG